jgi:hypothetical protein
MTDRKAAGETVIKKVNLSEKLALFSVVKSDAATGERLGLLATGIVGDGG